MSRERTSPRAGDDGFVLDTRTLGRRPGSMIMVSRTVPSPERIGLDMIAVEKDAPVDLDLRLESVSEGVLVTGTVHAPLTGECSRCLEPFTDDVDLYLTELFAYPDSVTEQTTDEDEVYRMGDDSIDLTQVIVDGVGLELPLQPLCSDDCPGLCSECGVRLAIAGSEHSHEIIDPRWAGLAAFGAGSTDSAPVDDAVRRDPEGGSSVGSEGDAPVGDAAVGDDNDAGDSAGADENIGDSAASRPGDATGAGRNTGGAAAGNDEEK